MFLLNYFFYFIPFFISFYCLFHEVQGKNPILPLPFDLAAGGGGLSALNADGEVTESLEIFADDGFGLGVPLSWKEHNRLKIMAPKLMVTGPLFLCCLQTNVNFPLEIL